MKNFHKAIIVTMLLFSNITFGQGNDLNFLNGMKYATFYGPKNSASYAKFALNKLGLTLISYDMVEWPKDAKFNSCLVSHWSCSVRGGMGYTAKATLTISNCYKDVLYEKTNSVQRFGVADFDTNAGIAYERTFDEFKDFDYAYDEKLTPSITYPEVETINKDENELKAYFDSTKTDPIEGIYKTYKSDANYKIGIINVVDFYKAIIIESDIPQWRKGEVLAVFESTAAEGVFSTKFYSANKTPIETFSNLEGGLINIEIKNSKGENVDMKLLKLYPKN